MAANQKASEARRDAAVCGLVVGVNEARATMHREIKAAQTAFCASMAEGVRAVGALVAANDRADEQQTQLQALTHAFTQQAAALALAGQSRGA